MPAANRELVFLSSIYMFKVFELQYHDTAMGKRHCDFKTTAFNNVFTVSEYSIRNVVKN